VAVSLQMLEYAAIAEAQRDCPSIQAAGDSSLSLQLVPFGTLRVLCDNKSHHLRPVILLGHRRQVVDAFHGIAHPGARATNRIMGQRVTWSSMNKDVMQCVKDWQTCSRAKVTWQAAAALQPISVLRQRFSHIHVDIVGLLSVSREGFCYLFTIIDRSSRLLEAVPLVIIETETCRDALISQWVARFGVSAHLTFDQGAQFTSALWARLCDVIGLHHNTTTAYHPQSNGMVERAHWRLKMHSRPAWPSLTGPNTCPGSSWTSTMPPRRTLASLRRRWCTAPL